ncbi:SulP family inorganic anion transporter [Corynebacterium kroppenstedtii]|nr:MULTISPECIES: SulP family inorganic anion transporter [Corynebacterium]MDN8623392.1 SulP family inorganic anion transporter [Corynebacterium kroppenstedtii]QRQ66108.1 SulP family inorganic anion transporter [Corynebacterium kroppenstedtii]
MKDAVTDHPATVGSFRSALSSWGRFRTEIFGGLVTSLALIPEVISFSIVEGVDPRVGLFTSFVMCVAIAFTGGRPAMVTAAAGSVALVMAPLVKNHGVDYLVPAVLLAGMIQIALGLGGVANLMRFIPRSVMNGFVNALAILIFLAQLQHVIHVPWMVYVLVVISLAIMIIWPRVNSVIPGPLVAIVVVTALAILGHIDVPTVRDQGELPHGVPSLIIPDVVFGFHHFGVIAPYALGAAIVGLIESLLTAKLVDDITDQHSDKTRESWGLGIANVASAFVGGQGGCAMIGQTMINVRHAQARTRLSTLLAGVFLLVLVVSLGEIVGQIPMAALVAVMFVVAFSTMDWHSVDPRTLRRMPLSETAVMGATIIATVVTNNLAVGVVCGVLGASVMFVRRVAHMVTVERVDHSSKTSRYRVRGQLFFASSNDLVFSFNYTDSAKTIEIDVSEAEVWDSSAVSALESIAYKYRQRGKHVHVVGATGASLERLRRLSSLTIVDE